MFPFRNKALAIDMAWGDAPRKAQSDALAIAERKDQKRNPYLAVSARQPISRLQWLSGQSIASTAA